MWKNKRVQRYISCDNRVGVYGRTSSLFALTSRSSFPVAFPSTAHLATPQRDHRVGSSHRPSHAALFQSSSNDCLTSGFYYPRSDEQPVSAKLLIAHPLLVCFEVLDRLANDLLLFNPRRPQPVQASTH